VVGSLQVLVILTFRPKFTPPWIGRPHVTMLTLNRLPRRHGAEIVAYATGGKVLSSMPDNARQQQELDLGARRSRGSPAGRADGAAYLARLRIIAWSTSRRTSAHSAASTADGLPFDPQHQDRSQVGSAVFHRPRRQRAGARLRLLRE
jgi:hypothetical protein